MKLCLNYETLYDAFKIFGIIERIKLKMADDEKYFEAFITFRDAGSASSAHEKYDGSYAEKSLYRTKLISSRNLVDEDGDYIPRLYLDHENERQIQRQRPTSYWHIASYKEGRENIIHGTKCLKRKLGFIDKVNIKKYGRSILVKAETKVQVAMLNNFIPSQDDVISKVVPHHTFNTLKGIVYSRDLFDFSDQEILEMCPSSVYEVKKLSGLNGAILLFFNTRFIPDYIDVEGIRIRVKKYKYKPRQCFQCFEFGHVISRCQNDSRCHSCSGIHENFEPCGPTNCVNCGGNHPPTSKDCSRFKFEQDILEVAHNEFISIGSAKRKVMGANQSPDSSYASVVREMKKRQYSNKKKLNHQSTSSARPESSNTKDPSAETPLKNNSNMTGTKLKVSSDQPKITPEKPISKSAIPSSHGGQSKTKKNKAKSTESLLDASIPTGQKMPREESDLEDFNLPNKRHRTQRSPKKTSDETDTSNRFTPLTIDENGQNQSHSPPSHRKSKSLVDNSQKQDKISNTPQKAVEQNGSKIKLQKNFSAQQKSSSFKKEQSNNYPK